MFRTGLPPHSEALTQSIQAASRDQHGGCVRRWRSLRWLLKAPLEECSPLSFPTAPCAADEVTHRRRPQHDRHPETGAAAEVVASREAGRKEPHGTTKGKDGKNHHKLVVD